jgi:hypothetical protein
MPVMPRTGRGVLFRSAHWPGPDFPLAGRPSNQWVSGRPGADGGRTGKDPGAGPHWHTTTVELLMDSDSDISTNAMMTLNAPCARICLSLIHLGLTLIAQ